MMMFLMRIASGIGLVFLIYQLAQEPEGLDNLSSFTNENFNDLFEWGNQRFVLGRIGDGKNITAQKRKTAQ
jgi:hypothetical protein